MRIGTVLVGNITLFEGNCGYVISVALALNPKIERIKMSPMLPQKKNNFLYFVADGSGGHVFSSSSSQHQQNVAAYRTWRRLQRQ